MSSEQTDNTVANVVDTIVDKLNSTVDESIELSTTTNVVVPVVEEVVVPVVEDVAVPVVEKVVVPVVEEVVVPVVEDVAVPVVEEVVVPVVEEVVVPVVEKVVVPVVEEVVVPVVEEVVVPVVEKVVVPVVEEVVKQDVPILAAETNEDVTNESDELIQPNKRNVLIDQMRLHLLTTFKQYTQTMDKSQMMKVLVRTMELIETTDIKGKEQRDVVIEILIKFLESDTITSPNKETLLSFLHNDASEVIDMIVDASKGNININAVSQKAGKRLLACIFKCFSTNKNSD